jgi:hypothetical protein
METDKENKVFVIGFNKTGTTSLKRALVDLGRRFSPGMQLYNSRIFEEVNSKNFSSLENALNYYDAFEDRPWNHPGVYQYLDNRFENAKFILTIRDVDNWVNSYKKWDKTVKLSNQSHYNTVSKICYGVNDFLSEENIMRNVYKKRNNEVIRYFRNKNNLLILDLEKGDGWNKLCPFLNLNVLKTKFPHANKNS